MIGTVLRRHVLPWSVWLAAMGIAGWLWYGINVGTARGYVEGIAYGVTVVEEGRLAEVLVTPGQRVRAGDVVARLDTRAIDAELVALAAEHDKVEAELGAVATQTDLIVGENSRDIEESVDSADVARQQARAARNVAAAELKAVEDFIELVEDLVAKRMADRRELSELLVKKAALAKELQTAEGVIKELDLVASSARRRREALPLDARASMTDPLRAELMVIEAQQSLLELRKDMMSLRSPGDGEVAEVLLHGGENVVPGTVVANIVGPALTTAAGTPIVFACMNESDAATVEIGEAVVFAPPEGGSAVLHGHVVRLAPQVVELPIRCWRDPKIPVWGRPVYIAVDDASSLLPGQGFSIKFTREVSERAGSEAIAIADPVARDPAAPVQPEPDDARPTGTPVAIAVPASLRAHTRFEPSAVMWSSSRRRYLVVSDDTGLDKTTEHVPWLFTMDERGRIDPEPLVIEGVAEVSDLESIAPAPGGGFYLLASQSRSRKGKRGKPRQFFGHVAFDGHRARVTASVALADLLDGASADERAALGLAGTDALDIEGMTVAPEGGLLLGLKAPADDAGHVAIWRLGKPDALLAAGRLAAGEPSLWGRVALEVTADGRPHVAGIAELLALPDGTVIIAATASGDPEPSSQDGAIYSVAGQTGLGSPSVIRRFAGLKPEGMSLDPSGTAIAVVFDLGDATPMWTELPWPAH